MACFDRTPVIVHAIDVRVCILALLALEIRSTDKILWDVAVSNPRTFSWR